MKHAFQTAVDRQVLCFRCRKPASGEHVCAQVNTKPDNVRYSVRYVRVRGY